MFLPAVTVGVVNMLLTSKLMSNQLEQGAERLFAQTANQAEKLYQDLETVENQFLKNEGLLGKLNVPTDRILTQIEASNRFYIFLENVKYINSNVNVTVFVTEPHYFSAYGLPVKVNQPFIKQVMEKGGGRFQRLFFVAERNGSRVLQWIVPLGDIVNRRSIGLLVIQVPFSLIDKIMNDGGHIQSMQFSMVDGNGTYIIHPKAEYSGQAMEQPASALDISYYHRQIGEDWTLIGEIPKAEILSPLKNLQKWTIVITIGQIVLTSCLAIWLARSFSRPIQFLASLIFKKKDQGADIVIPRLKRNDEIRFLYDGIRDLLHEIKLEQIQKQEYRLRMLQYQINPHFLYNSLDSIQWKAVEHRDKELSEMIRNLSFFLRHGLNQQDIVTIEEELKHLKSYIDLQKIRYQDQFTIHINISEEVLQQSIVKVSLQPLVENAIMHGMNRQSGGNRIEIAGHRTKDDRTIISIIDNGRNLDFDYVSKLLEQSVHANNNSQFGIRNVNERIKLYFGAEYGLTIYKLNFGTQFDVILPFV
jgi:sensor histidine kinase YesM